MLSWSCRRFRARFTPGSAHPHRRACLDCDAFATAVERAAGVRLPLPERLRKSLSAIPPVSAPEPGAVLPFPVPRMAMPEALAGRLRSIAPPARPAPPAWVCDPRYAVAASALLALLLGPLFLIGADRGLEALGIAREEIREEVVPILRHTGEEGREEIEKVRAGAAEAYDVARRSLARSAESLDALTDRLSTVVPDGLIVPDDFHNPDPGDEPAGSSRRPR